VRGGPAGDRVAVRVCGQEQAVETRSGETREVVFEPGAGFPYYDSFLTVLRLRSDAASSGPQGTGGTFAWITLEVDRRLPP